MNNKQIEVSNRRYFGIDLRNLQKKIMMLSKDINPKILKNLYLNLNPVKNNLRKIQRLMFLQQKLLSLTVIKYGIYDKKVISLTDNCICSLVFRVFAVSELFKNLRFKSLGMNNVVIK